MDTISILYTASGAIFGVAFFPQIITLLKDRTGAVSTNLCTWSMFTIYGLIALIYALTHTSDPYFIFCSAISAVGNASILALSCLRRMQYAKIMIHATQPARG